MNKFLKSIPAICFFLFFYTCKSSQETVSTLPKQKKDKITIKHSEKKLDTLFSNLEKNSLKFNTLKIQSTLNYQYNESKEQAKIFVRIKHNQLIWVSIRKLNLEVARVLISRDSMKIINRINKTYLSKNFNYLNKRFNLDINYKILEDLIIGNPTNYIDSEKTFVKKDRNRNLISISTVRKRKYKKTEKIKTPAEILWINSSYKIEEILFKNPQEKKLLQAYYKNFKKINQTTYPSLTTYNIPSSNTSLNIILSIKSLKIDEPLKTPFTIPKKYTIVP